MSIITNTNSPVIVSGLFESNNGRILQNANIHFIDTDTAQTVEMDNITLSIIDSAGYEQYLLSTVSTPPIVLEEPALLYKVSGIEVTGFPDGYVNLVWTGTLDGYDYTSTSTVAFNNVPAMVFVTGETSTISDFKFVLDTAKPMLIRTVDSLGNPVSGEGVRWVLRDKLTGTLTYHTATLISGGLWQNDITLTGISTGLDLYEIFAEISLDGIWREILNSRVPIQVFGATVEVDAGILAYNSNSDMYRAFPNLKELLGDIVPNQGEAEIFLNQNRMEASTILYNQVQFARIKLNRDLLKQLANYMTYKIILIKAQAFQRFGTNDSQLAAINNHISRLYQILFSPVATVRVI